MNKEQLSSWQKMSIIFEVVCHDCKHVDLKELYEKGCGQCFKDLGNWNRINIYPGFFCYNHEDRDSPTLHK